MLRQMHNLGIDPGSLIHALQNHDELTLELVHFWTLHAHDSFLYQGQTFPGNILREHIREQMYERLAGEHAPYNLKFVTNGVSCTTASIITAALGIRDLAAITPADIEQIRQIHLLLVMYNAMQPGVFALSGWDLVGALPLAADDVAHLMTDGDTRWIHRGAYDLVDLNPQAELSAGQMPRSKTLYGSLNRQLQDRTRSPPSCRKSSLCAVPMTSRPVARSWCRTSNILACWSWSTNCRPVKAHKSPR